MVEHLRGVTSFHLGCGNEQEDFKRPGSVLSPVLSQCDSTDITATLMSSPHDLDNLLITTVLYRRYESVHQVIVVSYKIKSVR